MLGCGIPSACNYDPTAIIQDFESCELPPAGYDCDGNFDGLQVGDFYLGGVVFQVWDEGAHGRVITPTSIGSAPWGCMDMDLGNPSGYGFGPSNTAQMLSECETPNAAQLVSNLGNDWYLPPSAELELALETLSDAPDGSQNFWQNVLETEAWGYNSMAIIAQYKAAIGWEPFGQDLCWSSSDVAGCCANCARVDWYTNQWKTSTYLVRGVREF